MLAPVPLQTCVIVKSSHLFTVWYTHTAGLLCGESILHRKTIWNRDIQRDLEVNSWILASTVHADDLASLQSGIQCGAVITRSIFTQILTKDTSYTRSSSYGVSFVSITSDACFASVIVVPYEKLSYVGPRYNDTQLAVGRLISHLNVSDTWLPWQRVYEYSWWNIFTCQH